MIKNNFYLLLASIFLLLTITTRSAEAADKPSEDVLKSFGISTEAIKVQAFIGFGITSLHSRYVGINTGYFVQTNDTMYVLVMPTYGKNYELELALPYNRIETAGLLKTGMFSHLRQIQLQTEFAMLVLSSSIGQTPEFESINANFAAGGVKKSGREVERTTDINGTALRSVEQ